MSESNVWLDVCEMIEQYGDEGDSAIDIPHALDLASEAIDREVNALDVLYGEVQ